MFETLTLNNDFEIYSQPPHEIRNKETKEILKTYISDYGHELINIPSSNIVSSNIVSSNSNYNFTTYAMARVVAIQWIPNPNNFKHITFIDGNRSHAFISNISWSEQSDSWDKLNEQPNYYIRYNPTIDAMEIKHNNSIILPSITPDNLLYIRSTNNHKLFIDQLVAEHYLSNPDNLLFIIHIDNNPLNNKPTNLQYSKFDVSPIQDEDLHKQPLNIKRLTKYDGDKFNNLYVAIDSQLGFIMTDDNEYLKLQTHSSKLGKYIQTLTTTNRKRRLYFSSIESIFAKMSENKSKRQSSRSKHKNRFITNQNHIIDYFDTLPENVIQIKSFNAQPLKQIYFYNPTNDTIIKQFNSKYRIIRSTTFQLEFNDGTKSNVQTKDLISSLTHSNDTIDKPTHEQQNMTNKDNVNDDYF